MFLLFGSDSSANSQIAPVLRGRVLEIIDDGGRVRAMIKVFPPSPDIELSDGTTGYSATVVIRLIDSEGALNVKIAATEKIQAMAHARQSLIPAGCD